MRGVLIDGVSMVSGQASLNNQAAPKPTHRKPPSAAIIALLIVAALGLWLAWRFWFSNPVDAHKLETSGRLEGYETNLGPKIGGRVDFIAVREGDAVKEGQIVAKLSDEDYQAQLRGAEARIAKARQSARQSVDQLAVVKAQIHGAQTRLSQSKVETSAQIDQSSASLSEIQSRKREAESQLNQAKADLELATIRVDRYTNLVKKGAVTKDEYDQARTTFNSSIAAVKAKEANDQAAGRAIATAQAALRQAQASKYTPPIRSSDINVFQAQLDQADHQAKAAQDEVNNAIAERDQIAANINYLTIRSPINGVVTARPAEPGAVLVPGQTVLTVIDLSKVYMRAYVPEGQVSALRLGQPASVVLDGRANKPFSGKIIAIDPEGSFTPENIYFKNDRVKQVFGIKIGIDHPDGFAKPGMPADATIQI